MPKATRSVALADWTERLKLYNAYIHALGRYKQDTARAELAQAEAAGNCELVRAKQLVIKQLETDLRRLHQVVAQNNREAALIADRQRRALRLVAGKRITGSLASAWSAYAWFEARALLESPQELYAVKLAPEARAAECFLDNRDESQPCDAAPETLETALALASWLRERSYVPRHDSKAQRAMSKLFHAINHVAARTCQELTQAIVKMRRGDYNAWRPAAILGVPPAAVALRIEAAGATRSAPHFAPKARGSPVEPGRKRNSAAGRARSR